MIEQILLLYAIIAFIVFFLALSDDEDLLTCITLGIFWPVFIIVRMVKMVKEQFNDKSS